jgi:hypothetical protein
VYEPSRRSFGAAANFVKENLNGDLSPRP